MPSLLFKFYIKILLKVAVVFLVIIPPFLWNAHIPIISLPALLPESHSVLQPILSWSPLWASFAWCLNIGIFEDYSHNLFFFSLPLFFTLPFPSFPFLFWLLCFFSFLLYAALDLILGMHTLFPWKISFLPLTSTSSFMDDSWIFISQFNLFSRALDLGSL